MGTSSSGIPDPQRSLPDRSRIAVVAVHGVGDHVAGASARNIADLLLRLRQDGKSPGENRYTSFKRIGLTIPVNKAYVSPGANVGIRAEDRTTTGILNRIARWRGAFQERSRALDLLTQRTTSDSDLVRGTDGADHQFMREQLLQYRSDGAPYESVRYEGHRLPPGKPNEPDADVHVYEMYWSDLSRLGSGFVQIANELFQLLFHIPHLGRQAVDHAVLEFPGDVWWRAYRWVHTAAVRLFTLLIPLLWLTMAATVLSVVPSATPYLWATMVATGAALLAGAIGGGMIVYRGAEKGHISPLLAIPAAGIASGAFVAYVLIPAIGVERMLTLEWIVAATAAVAWIAAKYDRVRPGARSVGRAIVVAAGITLAAALIGADEQETIVHRVLDVFEIETLAVLSVWLVFYLLALASGALGLITSWRATGAARDRARRAAWTARATLAMSAIGVLLVGLPIWSLIYKAFSFALPSYATYRSLTGVFGSAEMQPWLYIERVFDFASGPGLALLIVATAFVGLLLSVTIIPSVLAELNAPALDGSFAGAGSAGTAPRYREQSDASNRLGRWLSRGLRLVGGGVNLLYVAMIVGAALNLRHWATFSGRLFGTLDAGGFFATSAGWAKVLVLLSGAWLGATAVGLAAFRGRLQSLMLGIRPVLDAAIDVDNYLREHPRTGTPRARIAERYASLLRYLCKWRDASGTVGYDAIVIVAHSQGTVISADYLGFIEREPDPDLPVLLSTAQRLSQRDSGPDARADGPAIYLFTMGSPLQQLYGQAFPHLFAWVRGDSGAWRQVIEAPTAGIDKIVTMRRSSGATAAPDYTIDTAASPDPSKIGLERWVNAYRSGDYVGRALWRSEKEMWTYRPYFGAGDGYWSAPALVVSEDPARIRRELCIGQGAHTHYWDATARVIAQELDALIDDGTGRGASMEAGKVATPG